MKKIREGERRGVGKNRYFFHPRKRGRERKKKKKKKKEEEGRMKNG
jgi:hypothetical protein